MHKRVWEVCEPHPDVFARDMDPSMFAASLHAVEAGNADPDYTDPERFFAKTFMTRSLENVLEGVLARLLGQPGRGAPVLRLETPFGGGKTHTMVALFHLARHPQAVEETEAGQRLQERLHLPHLPHDVRVAVLDGAALNPHGRTVEGLTLRTLWGELVYQLGGKPFAEAVRASDEAGIAPGQAVLAELLRQACPALILMDEVMHYLGKARAIRVGDTNLAAQTVAFLRELTAAVGEVSQSVLILSLPASSLEVPAESQAQAEEMFQSVRKVVGRTELIETPVTQDEVFGVLKRRLFRRVGEERTARRVTEAFLSYYQEYARFFPEKLRSPSYRERMQAAYPFHPELVDLLYGRWGPHPQFQRTRGALRLMALVLRRLWNQRPGSAYLIQPHHIDLADRHIRAEVVRLLDSAFDTIITSDVVGKCREIDRELGGEYQREQLCEGAAGCALLYSVSAASDLQGCTEEELRVALLRPHINPAQVSEALGRLRNGLWYLRYRDHRYFFTAKPNLNKVVLDFEQGVSDEKVEESLYAHLAQVAGAGKSASSGEPGSALQVYLAPREAGAVSEPSRATLVLLPLSVGETAAPWEEEVQEWMRRVVTRLTHRNLLIFLAPQRAQEGALRAAVRRWLALQSLQQSQLFRELDKEDREEVEQQFREKEGEIAGLLLATYSRLFRPSAEGVEELRILLKRDGKTLVEMVAAALKERGILVDSLSPEYLSDTLGVGQRPVSLAEVQTVLVGSPGQPVVSEPRKMLEDAIREGVQRGLFAVRAGNQIYRDHVPEEVLDRADAVLVAPQEAPPKPEVALSPAGGTLRVTGGGENLYPLRKLLEEVQGADVSVTLTLEDPLGVLTPRRSELERLLNDYSVPYEWMEGESTD
jgi:hypothetical protein